MATITLELPDEIIAQLSTYPIEKINEARAAAQ